MIDPDYTVFLKSWRQRPYLAPLCIILSLALALLWLNVTTPRFTAKMVIGPTAREGVAGRGSRLALQNIQNEKIRLSPAELSEEETLSDYARFVQLLTAPEIAAILLKNKKLNAAETLLQPQALGAAMRNFMRRIAGQSFYNARDETALADYLHRHLVVQNIGRSAMREVIFRYPDRRFAISLLNALHFAADAHLKSRARERTEAEIAYLRNALQNVTVTEYRLALTNLLAMEEQTKMMINVDLPFAADQIQAAQSAPNTDWPSAPLTLLLALACGIFVACSLHYCLAARACRPSL